MEAVQRRAEARQRGSRRAQRAQIRAAGASDKFIGCKGFSLFFVHSNGCKAYIQTNVYYQRVVKRGLRVACCRTAFRVARYPRSRSLSAAATASGAACVRSLDKICLNFRQNLSKVTQHGSCRRRLPYQVYNTRAARTDFISPFV